jgi:hypothetical protein
LSEVKRKRGRPKKGSVQSSELENNSIKKSYYWNKETDQAILLYNSLNSGYEKTSLFNRLIYPAIQKLALNVFNYVRYTKRLEWDDLKQQETILEAETLLSTTLHFYKDIKLSAFSYFQSVAKHFYLDEIERTYKNKLNNIALLSNDEQSDDEDGINDANSLQIAEELYSDYLQEFVDNAIEKIDGIDCGDDIELKLILSKIKQYLLSEEDLSINGLRIYLFNEVVDKGLSFDWKIDRLLSTKANIFLALKDRTDYKEYKKDKTYEEPFDWLDDYLKEKQRDPNTLNNYYLKARKKTKEYYHNPENREKIEELRKKFKSENVGYSKNYHRRMKEVKKLESKNEETEKEKRLQRIKEELNKLSKNLG